MDDVDVDVDVAVDVDVDVDVGAVVVGVGETKGLRNISVVLRKMFSLRPPVTNALPLGNIDSA